VTVNVTSDPVLDAVGINKYGEDVVSSSHSGGSVLSESHGCVHNLVDGIPWDGGSPAVTSPLVRSGASDDPMNQMGVRMATESAKELSAVLKKSDILGIEIYQGPTTPAQYNQGGGNCATIIVWTKENVHSR